MPDDNKNLNGEGTNADGDTADAGKTTTSKEDSGKQKVTFSSEQQVIVNSLIDTAFGKAFDKGRASLETELAKATERLTALQQEVTTLRTQGKSEDKAAGEADANKQQSTKEPKKPETPSADMQQLLARIEELTSSANTIKAERDAAKTELVKVSQKTKDARVKDAFLEAAKDIQFFDAGEVYSLLRGDLELDEELDAVVVKNVRTGQPRLNSNMDPMTLAEYLAEFAAKKPYMVRASSAEGGTGASSSRRTETKGKSEYDAETVARMTNAEFEALRNKILMQR